MMTAYGVSLIQGDCLEQLKTLPDCSVDSLVTDPPAGISFMGKDWDCDKGGRDVWISWMASIMEECMRVLKPGAHGLVWALPRTSHWTATALEDAGFRVKDSILHCFGSGFPKSTNVKKQAEKAGIACVCDENVSDMRNDLDAEGSVSGDAQSDMQSHLLRKTGETYLHGSAKAETSVRGVRPDVSTKEPHRTRKSKTLLLSLQGRDQDGRSSDKSAAQADRFKHEGSKARASIRGKQPSVEGRNHLQTEQGQLHRAEVCQVSKRIPVDGSQGRLRDGAQASHGDAPRAPSKPSGMRASQGPQHSEQSDIESGMVSGQPITQACGRCGKTRIAEGYGSALKPAVEIWWLVQKPLEKNLTISANVLKWGTGALNIDASRIHPGDEVIARPPLSTNKHEGYQRPWNDDPEMRAKAAASKAMASDKAQALGRFPANLVLSGDAPEMLDEQSGRLKSGARNGIKKARTPEHQSFHERERDTGNNFDSSKGGASRFFYCAKISKSERNAGLDTPSTHPTVKPKKLMAYLIRMITPPGGTVLDPFMGSGSTGVAAKACGFNFIGIEREPEYVAIAEKRIEHAHG